MITISLSPFWAGVIFTIAMIIITVVITVATKKFEKLQMYSAVIMMASWIIVWFGSIFMDEPYNRFGLGQMLAGVAAFGLLSLWVEIKSRVYKVKEK